MTSKKLEFIGFVAAFAVVLYSASLTQAQTNPPQQTVNGSVGQQFNTTDGNQKNTGGWTNGSSGGAFDANGKHLAMGGATTSGSGAGTFVNKPDSSFSQSNAVVSSLSGVKGDSKKDNVIVGGNVGQGDWSSKGSGMNYANAGNATDAGYSGSVKGPGTLQLSGNGTAKGQSWSKVDTGKNNSSTQVQTIGSSTANLGVVMDPKGPACHHGPAPMLSSNVNGAGAVNAQSFTGNPKGSYSGADLNGGAEYNGFTAGSLQLNGKTSSSLSPGGTAASASSTLQAISQGK